MISTVVTASTFSTVAATTITGSLALASVLVLLASLIQKDATSVEEGQRFQRLNQAINIALPPMLITFIVLVIVKISDLLY